MLFFVFESCSFFFSPDSCFFLLYHSVSVWWNSSVVPEACRVFSVFGSYHCDNCCLSWGVFICRWRSPTRTSPGSPLLEYFWNRIQKEREETKELRLLALFGSANHRYVEFLWYKCSTSHLLRSDKVLGKLRVLAEYIRTCWLRIVSMSHQNIWISCLGENSWRSHDFSSKLSFYFVGENCPELSFSVMVML